MHPKVREVFARLHKVSSSDLCTGLDVTGYAAPDTEGLSNGETRLNMHVDKNHKAGIQHLCAQGIFYVWPSTVELAFTTAMWPRSYTDVYDELMKDAFAIENGRRQLLLTAASQSVPLNTFCDFDRHEKLLSRALQDTRRVPCPSGSLLVFDSRLLHQPCESGHRLTQPVCWEATKYRSEEALLRKPFCCITGLPTSHSSVEGRVHDLAWRGIP